MDDNSGGEQPALLESMTVAPPKDLPTDTKDLVEKKGSDGGSSDLSQVEESADHSETQESCDHPQTDSVSSFESGSSETCIVNTDPDCLLHHTEAMNNHLVSGQEAERTEEPDQLVEEGESANGVYSSVVSPHKSNREPSPLNTLSLEQELKQEQQNRPSQLQGLTRTDSPALEDRNLEQFSEILLDSDPSQSDEEANKTTEPKKPRKKVRFADEVEERHTGLSRSSTHSPPLRPSTISSPEDVARQGRVPVSPSSPKQPQPTPQYSVNDLIAGVDFSAQYLGSTPIFLSGVASAKSSRMYQAQQAVKMIKDPENEGRPQCAVNVKISTQAITISDCRTNIDMMEHPLHTISYVADIDNVLVVMAHVVPTSDPTPPSPVTTPVENREELIGTYIPKMTCHVLDTENARLVAMVIGQAFSAAYKQFLRSNGISEEALEQAEYAHILNAQTVPQVEVESFNDRNKTRKLTLAKHRGELMGVMVMESGYGSAIPSCVIAHLNKSGAAKRCGLLNVGDHIISINGVNLVGMPKKTCIEQLKKCRYQDVVKMTVCSCPAVVEVTIVRPDLKYQLGFSVQKGMITSLIRGSIAERSGIRVGHRIIEINGTSTVSMDHNDIVHLLSCTVGDLHLRTMPDLMYKLLTGQIVPDYH